MARALNDGVLSLKDRDFSVSVTRASDDELGELVASYNGLGDRLRVERQSLYQRELMLDTVIQTTPLALVLTNEADAVIYSNATARQLFGGGRKLEGERFASYLEHAPAPLREAIERGGDTLFTLELAGEPQVYHVSQRRFLLNALPHRLLLLKQLTREINSQEVATWKKVIRVIAHELNNSLAPDLIARALGADPGPLAAQSRTTATRVFDHRRPRQTPGGLHRGLFAVRQAAASAARARGLGSAARTSARPWSRSRKRARCRNAWPVSIPRRSSRR